MESSLFSDFWPQCKQARSLQLALQENILPFKSKKQAATGEENQLIKRKIQLKMTAFLLAGNK